MGLMMGHGTSGKWDGKPGVSRYDRFMDRHTLSPHEASHIGGLRMPHFGGHGHFGLGCATGYGLGMSPYFISPYIAPPIFSARTSAAILGLGLVSNAIGRMFS